MSIKRKNLANAQIRILMILFAIINIFPVIFALYTSFKDNKEFYKNMWSFPQTLRYQNYIEAFNIGKLGEYSVNSVIIAALTLTAALIFSVLAAYALSRLNIPGAEMILVMLILIQVLPTESLIIPEYMIVSKLGLMKIPYMAMVLPYISWNLPGDIIILSNFFKTVPTELIESARLDGATEFKTLTNVIVPLMKAPVCTCLIFNFCGVWGELMWAQITTLTTDKGIPLTIGLLNFKGIYGTNWGVMTAAICIIIIPMYILFIFTQKYFVEGLTAGSVKG